jgi:hypothetical protein
MRHCSGGGGQLSFSIQVPHGSYYTPLALRFTPIAIPLRRLAPQWHARPHLCMIERACYNGSQEDSYHAL